MENIEIFNIVSGIASILSLIIGLVALKFIKNINTKIQKNNKNVGGQAIQNSKINGSNVTQVGGDNFNKDN